MICVGSVSARTVIEVPPSAGDATMMLQAAIDSVAACGGLPVTLKLASGDYNISRECASRYLYHISNTSSAGENPDQTKHIGLWFKDLKNVTVDGCGACIITHGEMTPIVIDGCQNVKLMNFTLTAADPSVPEFKVVRVRPDGMTVEVTPPSEFEIDSHGNFFFVGYGWRLGQSPERPGAQVLAQVYHPETNTTRRCPSPLQGCRRAVVAGDRLVDFEFDRCPQVHVGEIYQLRHGIRNEACAFINRSRDVVIENAELNFLGNFGLVGQFSENITYRNIRCRPQLGSSRTDAGFADFVQMSGCKGKIRILDSHFEGSHDDPINIHGTHLKAVATDGKDRLTVRFMRGQTFGFAPFVSGDSIEFVDRHTLNCLGRALVKNVHQANDYDFELSFDREIPVLPDGYTIGDLAVENITWVPEVEIVNNYFARTPTRGILITTRGRSLIENNTFFRIPMPAILVSDDARSWYESGPVRDLTIRRNRFIECGSPVISISPEIDSFNEPVHRNVLIESNRFTLGSVPALKIDASDNVKISDNVFDLPSTVRPDITELIESSHTIHLEISGNAIVSK